MKTGITFSLICLLSTTVLAGGGIFGHKTKKDNPDGVSSVGMYFCSDLDCPPIRVGVQLDCKQDNMEWKYGVCLCKSGYVAVGSKCQPCPAGQFSDGFHGCRSCPAGTFSIPGSPECSPCGTNTYSPAGSDHCLPCPENAKCTDTDFSCDTGYIKSDDGLSCVMPYKPNECSSEQKCADGATCVNGVCVCSGEGQVYTLGSKTPACVAVEGGCRSNSDCASGEYCDISNQHLDEPEAGKCMAVGTPINENGLVYADTVMSWYAANNYCKAIERNLISVKTAGITDAISHAPFMDSHFCFGNATHQCQNLSISEPLQGAGYFWVKGSDNHPYVVIVNDQYVADYQEFDSVFFKFYVVCE